jgi:hypothetical protein
VFKNAIDWLSRPPNDILSFFWAMTGAVDRSRPRQPAALQARERSRIHQVFGLARLKGVYVARILKDEKPGELPVQRGTKILSAELIDRCAQRRARDLHRPVEGLMQLQDQIDRAGDR